MAGVYSLAAIEIAGAPTIIDQITQQQVDPGLTHMVQSGSSRVDPQFIAATKQRPAVTFTTSALGAALAACGMDGLAIAEANAVKLWFRKLVDEDIGYETGGDHVRVTVNKGLMFLNELEGSVDGDEATGSWSLVPVYDDTNNPVVVEAGQDYSLAAQTPQYFTIGPGFVNGAELDGVQRLRFRTGIELRRTAAAGSPYLKHVSIKSRRPVWEWENEDLAQLPGLTTAGIARSGITRAFFQSVLADGAMDLRTNLTHIAIEAAAGVIYPGVAMCSVGQEAKCPISVASRGDDGMTITIAQDITGV